MKPETAEATNGEICAGKIITHFRLSPLCISGQFSQIDLLIYPEDRGNIFILIVGNTGYLSTTSSPTVVIVIIIIATFQSQ